MQASFTDTKGNLQECRRSSQHPELLSHDVPLSFTIFIFSAPFFCNFSGWRSREDFFILFFWYWCNYTTSGNRKLDFYWNLFRRFVSLVREKGKCRSISFDSRFNQSENHVWIVLPSSLKIFYLIFSKNKKNEVLEKDETHKMDRLILLKRYVGLKIIPTVSSFLISTIYLR